jgi:hypothetical protein
MLATAQETEMAEDVAVASPAIGDATVNTEDTKAKSTGWDGIPETIRNLLYNPPVLPHENEDSFFALFDSFVSYASPENIIEFHLVYTATVCKWEADRYRFMTVAVTSNYQQAGLASLFQQTDQLAFGTIGELSASINARKNAMRCFTDSDYREETYIDFENRGYIPDGQAFLLALPALATIERLLASAEKRYVAAMKELEKRRASRAAKPVSPNN